LPLSVTSLKRSTHKQYFQQHSFIRQFLDRSKMSAVRHQLPTMSNSDDRLLREVCRRVGGVSAETHSARVGTCG
jgi:hypothetical protein